MTFKIWSQKATKFLACSQKLPFGALSHDIRTVLRVPCCEEIQASWRGYVTYSSQLQLWSQRVAGVDHQTPLDNSSHLCSSHLCFCTFQLRLQVWDSSCYTLYTVQTHRIHKLSLLKCHYFRMLCYTAVVTGTVNEIAKHCVYRGELIHTKNV